MISALYSNPNFDDPKAQRESSIRKIEEQYEDTVKMIYSGAGTQEEKIDRDNPFFAAMERGLPEVDHSAGIRDAFTKEAGESHDNPYEDIDQI